jgi:hypothetical protein
MHRFSTIVHARERPRPLTHPMRADAVAGLGRHVDQPRELGLVPRELQRQPVAQHTPVGAARSVRSVYLRPPRTAPRSLPRRRPALHDKTGSRGIDRSAVSARLTARQREPTSLQCVRMPIGSDKIG